MKVAVTLTLMVVWIAIVTALFPEPYSMALSMLAGGVGGWWLGGLLK